ncbi:MAG: hypothetical protein JWQ22_973 [Devosia sp.]|nr:hypothetical protein [Devosia sp.]
MQAYPLAQVGEIDALRRGSNGFQYGKAPFEGLHASAFRFGLYQRLIGLKVCLCSGTHIFVLHNKWALILRSGPLKIKLYTT